MFSMLSSMMLFISILSSMMLFLSHPALLSFLSYPNCSDSYPIQHCWVSCPIRIVQIPIPSSIVEFPVLSRNCSDSYPIQHCWVSIPIRIVQIPIPSSIVEIPVLSELFRFLSNPALLRFLFYPNCSDFLSHPALLSFLSYPNCSDLLSHPALLSFHSYPNCSDSYPIQHCWDSCSIRIVQIPIQSSIVEIPLFYPNCSDSYPIQHCWDSYPGLFRSLLLRRGHCMKSNFVDHLSPLQFMNPITVVVASFREVSTVSHPALLKLHILPSNVQYELFHSALLRIPSSIDLTNSFASYPASLNFLLFYPIQHC